TVNGYTWRTSVARMGGEFLVGLRRDVREAAGVAAGDTVSVVLALDTEPREVELPPALAAALERDDAAREAFHKLAFTHRNEYARWIADAKRDETRDRRVAKALAMLRDGETLS